MSKQTARIVVVGSYNADLTTYMQRFPTPGETVKGDRFVAGAGGKGSNQAIAAARLGAQVTFVGRVGIDSFGDTAMRMWEAEGIDTRAVIRDPDHATGVAPIFVDSQGENMIVVALGANLAVSKADVDAAADIIAQADVLITQFEIDHATAAYALEIAKSRGVRTILNPAPAVRLAPEITALADILTPNETELAIIGGIDANSEKPLEAIARSVLTRPDQAAVVTLGKQGAGWITTEATGRVDAYPVQAVDTTGAGDAFNAGLAVALSEGKPLHDALRFANATAALCVTRPGTAASMPRRDEVERFLTEREHA